MIPNVPNRRVPAAAADLADWNPSSAPATTSIVLLLALSTLLAGCRSPRPAGPQAPTATLRPAPLLYFRGGNSSASDKPGDTDCNSPLHWDGPTLYMFNSSGHPWRSSGPDPAHLDQSYLRCEYNNATNGGRWIECTAQDNPGTLYGWYHFEPTGLCPGTGLTAPRIGAARSRDNGATWEDLGVILEAPPGSLNCDTRNFYFAGGHGDFCALLNPKKQFVYFLVSTYVGPASAQGVALARMPWHVRDHPVGTVQKWHNGQWTEPGIGGQFTPIFPARIDWHRADADAFWGPSVHWNHHLQRYVMLLNRAVDKDWSQEGVYVSFSHDLSDPLGWTPPRKILDGLRRNQWYPQVVGLDVAHRETDKLAGHIARLFVRGESRWEIVFEPSPAP